MILKSESTVIEMNIGNRLKVIGSTRGWVCLLNFYTGECQSMSLELMEKAILKEQERRKNETTITGP